MSEQQQTLTIQQALDLALQHHTAGRLSQAENIYQQILQSHPDQPHALHLLGGLWVWSKSLIRLLSLAEPQDVRLSIELCTLYWHFLLIVWLVMFAILSNT